MKKVNCIILDRSDLKDAFNNEPYLAINPYFFNEKAVKKFLKCDVCIFVNKMPNQTTPDLRTRVLKCEGGLYGVVKPLSQF